MRPQWKYSQWASTVHQLNVLDARACVPRYSMGTQTRLTRGLSDSQGQPEDMAVPRWREDAPAAAAGTRTALLFTTSGTRQVFQEQILSAKRRGCNHRGGDQSGDGNWNWKWTWTWEKNINQLEVDVRKMKMEGYQGGVHSAGRLMGRCS